MLSNRIPTPTYAMKNWKNKYLPSSSTTYIVELSWLKQVGNFTILSYLCLVESGFENQQLSLQEIYLDLSVNLLLNGLKWIWKPRTLHGASILCEFGLITLKNRYKITLFGYNKFTKISLITWKINIQLELKNKK